MAITAWEPSPLATLSGPSSTLPVPRGGVAGPVTSAPGPPAVSLKSFQKYHPFIADGLTTTVTGTGVEVAVAVAVGVEVAVAVGVEVELAVAVAVGVDVGVAVAVAVGVGEGVTTVIGTLTGWLSTVTVAIALLALVELKVELSTPAATVPLVGVIVPLVAL